MRPGAGDSPPVDLLDACASPWASAASHISGALLYLDEGAAAAAASAGGAPLLLGLGARAVCDLDTARETDARWAPVAASDSARAVCIVVTRPLDACMSDVVSAVKVHDGVNRVAVLCAVPESSQSRGVYSGAVHTLDKLLTTVAKDAPTPARDGWEGDGEWDEDAWEQNADEGDAPRSGRVAVEYFPLCVAPVGKSALTLPPGSHAAVAPLSAPGEFTARGSLPAPPAPVDDVRACSGADAGVDAHAAALGALGDALQVHWEVFALGPTATSIARAMAASTSSASAPVRGGSLVLVDRTCDVATAVCPSDALLEHAPRRCATGDAMADALVDALHLPKLVGAAGVTGPHAQAMASLEDVCGRRLREGAMAARKALLEIMRRASITPVVKPKLGAVSAAEMRALAQQVMEHSAAGVQHTAVALHALAVADALDSSIAAESHAAAVKAMVAAAADSGAAGVGNWLVKWLESAPPQPENAHILHAVLTVAYALAGDVMPDDAASGASARGAFQVDRTLVQGPLPPAVERLVRDTLLRIHGQLQSGVVAATMRAWVDTRIGRLHALAHARRPLRSGAATGRSSGGATPLHGPCHVVPALVKALATRAVLREDVPELTHVPSSLGGLLKSSFGLLGLQSRPKPGDAPLVLLFVVGGLSAAELRDAREAAAIANASATGAGDGPRVELLLGGTCLLSATDLVTALWD